MSFVFFFLFLANLENSPFVAFAFLTVGILWFISPSEKHFDEDTNEPEDIISKNITRGVFKPTFDLNDQRISESYKNSDPNSNRAWFGKGIVKHAKESGYYQGNLKNGKYSKNYFKNDE